MIVSSHSHACQARLTCRTEFEDGFLRSELETRLLHIQPGEIVLQGKISGPTQRVVNYLMTQEATTSGLAGSGRIDQPQKALTPSKAASLVSDFYQTKDEESGSSTANKGKCRDNVGSNGKNGAAGSFADESDHGMSIDLTIDDDDEGLAQDGSALSTVLALPERVMLVYLTRNHSEASVLTSLSA